MNTKNMEKCIDTVGLCLFKGTRANNVNQSARLFTFCVLGQSECLKFEIYKQLRNEKITPCSTPSVPFDIKYFTPKLTNSDKACFHL